MTKTNKTITVNVPGVVTASTSYEGDTLLVALDGKVLNPKQFVAYFEALSTIHSYHDFWELADTE